MRVRDGRGRVWRIIITDQAAAEIDDGTTLRLNAWRDAEVLTVEDWHCHLHDFLADGKAILAACWACVAADAKSRGIDCDRFIAGIDARTVLAMRNAFLFAMDRYLPGKRIAVVTQKALAHAKKTEPFSRIQRNDGSSN